MDLGLKSKKALVFGGSSGLGLAAARSLAAEGAEIFLISRDKKKLKSARDEIKKDFGVSCEYACFDMTNSDEIDNFINNIKSSDFNILINNTGGPPPSNTSNTKSDYWEKYINSIILNTIKVTDNLLDYMKENKWGRVITITSSGVVQPINDLLISNTLRPAITGYMKTLSNEVSQYGITVNTIMPGRILTNRTLQVNQSKADKAGISYEEAIDISSSEIPIKRLGKPEEFGDVVCFLASEKASYISGSNFRVDGGLIKSI